MTLTAPVRKPRRTLKQWMQTHQPEVLAIGLLLIGGGAVVGVTATSVRSPQNAVPALLVAIGAGVLAALYVWWVVCLTPKTPKEETDVSAQP